MAWTSLCEFSDLEENKGKYVEIGGFQLAVFRSGKDVFVMDNYCPHAGGNLAGGSVEDGCAVVPGTSGRFGWKLAVFATLRASPSPPTRRACSITLTASWCRRIFRFTELFFDAAYRRASSISKLHKNGKMIRCHALSMTLLSRTCQPSIGRASI